MQNLVTLVSKILRLLYSYFRVFLNNIITKWKLYSNNVKFSKVSSNGIPFVMVARGGSCSIGNNLRLNNGNLGNPIGRPQKCIIFVDTNATLSIGNNVGISSTAIIAHKDIKIGDNVKIGGGVCIYDTDFHSLDPTQRNSSETDKQFEQKMPVSIGDNVFIGAHSTILKGVSIGKNSIIGACSLVTKSIPENEIWAGNPARFIKKLIQ